MPGPRSNKLDYLKTLARVSYFVESGEPFTLEQIADALGEHWRTAFRYLGELKALGFQVETVQIGKLRRLQGTGKLIIEKVIARVLKECREEVERAD